MNRYIHLNLLIENNYAIGRCRAFPSPLLTRTLAWQGAQYGAVTDGDAEAARRWEKQPRSMGDRFFHWGYTLED